MKSIKFIYISCILLNIFSGFSKEYVTLRDHFDQISHKIKSDREIEEEYYMSVIPKEYADAFLYYTRDYPEMRRSFYSIMVYESSNFTKFVNKNKNGTYDYGPSQLNSANLKNSFFRKYYRPTDESHITTRYCFYMVMTINLYKTIINIYGGKYVYYAYNGGDKAAKIMKSGKIDPKYNNLIKNVKNYDYRVRKVLENHNKTLDNYIECSRNEHIESLITEYNKNKKILSINNSIIDKRVCKFINYRIPKCITRRDDFPDFEDEEFGIIIDPKISVFDKHIVKKFVSRAFEVHNIDIRLRNNSNFENIV